MAIVHLKNKQNGTTYVYESENYWDKNKKQSRSRRKCLGKLDPATGELILSKNIQYQLPVISKPGPVPITEIKHSFYGATFLLDNIGELTGITADLRKCFPTTYKQILSIAYFLILEDYNPLYRFPKWSATHRHPYGKDITSQRSSEFFMSITEADRERFFQLQGRRRLENEYWAYDITSLSSYSECLKQVRYGKNKEHDHLEQINLAMLFGEKSGLPFYYRKLPGNIPDVKTVKNLLSDIDFLDYGKVKLVMDRGFYSEENINGLFHEHLKFIVATKTNLRYVKDAIDSVKPTIGNWSNYDPDQNLYITSQSIWWDYRKERPNKGDIERGKRRVYLHIYFDKERESNESQKFSKQLVSLKRELESGKRVVEHEPQYVKYFLIEGNTNSGIKVIPRQEVIDLVQKHHGFFALLSNDVKDPILALQLYRSKDLIEKGFGDLKDHLSFRRMEVSSELSLDGKLFIEFIALIFLSYIKKIMQDKHLFQNYTMHGLLDEFDIIDCYEQPGHDIRWGETTKKQRDLFKEFGVQFPTTL